MKRDSVENFRRILSRLGMWVNSDTLEPVLGFVRGFDAASDPPILEGFREWMLATYPQCSGPFGFEVFLYQIFAEEQARGDISKFFRIRALWTAGQEREAVDTFIAILTRFLDHKYGKVDSDTQRI